MAAEAVIQPGLGRSTASVNVHSWERVPDIDDVVAAPRAVESPLLVHVEVPRRAVNYESILGRPMNAP